MNPSQWFFGPPTRDQFARAMIAEFRRAGDVREYQYDKAEFRLTTADGGIVNLTNMFQEFAQLPRRDRKAHLRELAQGLVSSIDELPESFEEARPNLRPKVWTRGTFAALELKQRLQDGKPVDTPRYQLGSHFVTTVVYDMPTSMRTLSTEDFDKWGVSYYEAMEIACENLAETSIAFSQIGDGFHSAVSGDNYDSSRILLTDKVMSWSVAGDHVAMIPQRDALYVTGSEDDVGLKIMLSLTEATLRDEARPLCPIPLRFVDGEWEDWMVPRAHELFPQFRELESSFLGDLYAEQKALLEAIHEKEGIDIFVASFSGIRTETGRVITYCVWTDGIESLLPKTDLIMVGSESAAYEWDRVVDVAGHLLEPMEDLYPVRYRVSQVPTDEELRTIGAADI